MSLGRCLGVGSVFARSVCVVIEKRLEIKGVLEMHKACIKACTFGWPITSTVSSSVLSVRGNDMRDCQFGSLEGFENLSSCRDCAL